MPQIVSRRGTIPISRIWPTILASPSFSTRKCLPNQEHRKSLSFRTAGFRDEESISSGTTFRKHLFALAYQVQIGQIERTPFVGIPHPQKRPVRNDKNVPVWLRGE